MEFPQQVRTLELGSISSSILRIGYTLHGLSSAVNLEALRGKITPITLQKLIAKSNIKESIKIGLVEDFDILSELINTI